jgi:predicted oxidoreductase
LLSRIIANAISSIVLISDKIIQQQRPYSSFIRQIREKAIEYNTSAYLCFIDLTKAFDRIKLNDVVNALQKKNTPQRIKDLNTGNITQLKVNETLTKEIATTSGIRQRDSLSPLLLNTIMDGIIDEVKKSWIRISIWTK